MKVIQFEGKEYILAPSTHGCEECAIWSIAMRCPVDDKGVLRCLPGNGPDNLVLRPNTPEERAEAFARKVE